MPYGPRSKYRHTKLEPKRHFARGSFRTISIGRRGKRMLVGCPKGSWSRKARHCRSGMRRVALLSPKRAANPRRYTVVTAPRRVRLKWLRKAIAAKKYYARCRHKYGVQLHRSAGAGHLSFTTGSGVGPVIPPPSAPVAGPSYLDTGAVATNPELLVYTNPGSLSFNKRRRSRRRNYPITVKNIGGHRHTWKALVRKVGVTKAAKMWRSGKHFHGYTKTRCANRGRCGSGKASRYRALVRRHGMKIAARMWRKRGKR
jgi:hypothetical protein